MKTIYNFILLIIIVLPLTSCQKNIIDDGMTGMIEQVDSMPIPTHDEAIDLGLSIKWAPYNLGASKPEEYGNSYIYGSPKSYFEAYKDFNYNWWPYDQAIYMTEYDAAFVNWNRQWRLPTKDEILELYNECQWSEDEKNGVKGMTITGPNGNSIFLPAAGICIDKKFENVGIMGYYWNGNMNSFYDDYDYDTDDYLQVPYFYDNAINRHFNSDGRSIRPVQMKYNKYIIPDNILKESGWSYGEVFNNIYIVWGTDTDDYSATYSLEYGIISTYLNNYDKIHFIINNRGKVGNIYTDNISCYITYSDKNILVTTINNDGYVNTKTIDLIDGDWMYQLYMICSFLKEDLISEASIGLKNLTLDFVNIPENLFLEDDNITSEPSDIYGYIHNKQSPYNDHERLSSIFGEVEISLNDIRTRDDEFIIYGNLLNMSTIPSLTDFKYGITYSFSETKSAIQTPDTENNENKWEYLYTGNEMFYQALGKDLNFGWHTYRPYVYKAGIIKYGKPAHFFSAKLETYPTYKITNLYRTYIDSENVEVTFDCTLSPLEDERITYQGLQINTFRYLDDNIRFGAGTYTKRVQFTVNKRYISDGYLTLDVIYWYNTTETNDTFEHSLIPIKIAL